MLRPDTDGSPSREMIYRLGVVDMRLLAAAEDTGGAFALGEFRGASGAWTVPHAHRETLETFFVVAGRFTFTVGGEDRSVDAGELVLVPRDTAHVLRADVDDSRLLVLWTPGGLEQMFVELSGIAPDALRDPATRRSIASRYDSIPV